MKEKEKPSVYVVKELVDEKTYSELDFVLHDQFKFDYQKNESFRTIEKGESDNASDAYPINIATLIKQLQKMQLKGATHVQIEHHVDHIGYDISAWKIQKASQQQIDELQTKDKKKKEKNAKIKSLQQAIDELKGED